MANKLYEEASIQAIADAIRGKNGSTDTYTVGTMAAAIDAIEAGGSGGGEGWVRPAEWPDLDALVAAEGEGWVGAYLLADARLSTVPQVDFYTTNSLPVGAVIDIWNYENDTLTHIYNETVTTASDAITLSTGCLKVIRITGTTIIQVGKASSSSNNVVVEAYLQGLTGSPRIAYNVVLQHAVLKNMTYASNSMNYAFSNNFSLKKIEFYNCSFTGITGLTNLFSNNYALESVEGSSSIISGADTSSSIISSLVSACHNLKTFKLDFNCSVFKTKPFSGVYNLENFSGWVIPLERSSSTWSFTNCPLLTHDSLINIINGLCNSTYSSELQLAGSHSQKLSAEEIALATNKNWTVSFSNYTR